MIAAPAGSVDTARYLDSINSNPGDKLPVVELRPFTKKQWLPSKSRPNHGHQQIPTRAQTSLGISSSTVAKGMTPRTSMPCPRAFSVTGERLTKHPPLRESKNDAWKEADTPVTAFVSKLDRQSTTLDQVRTGQNVNSQYSCMKRSLTEDNINQQKGILIRGTRMEKMPPKLNNFYCEPWQLYNNNNITKQMMVETLCMRIESLENAYLDESIYDPFDRARTLPSIHVKPAHMAEKVESPRPQPATTTTSAPYRLGVTNTLDVMSHIGRPTGVEQKISSDLKQTLQHYRRTKDNVQLMQLSGMKGLPSRMDSGNPTLGEANLARSLSKNMPQHKTNSNSSKSKSTISDSVSSHQMPALTSVKPPGSQHSDSRSILSASWSQAESVPNVIKSMTPAEFHQTHQVAERLEEEEVDVGVAEDLDQGVHEREDLENNNDTNGHTMDLESVQEPSVSTRPVSSISQEILTIPTDEASLKLSQDEGGIPKSTVFITDTKDADKELFKDDNQSMGDNTENLCNESNGTGKDESNNNTEL